MRQLQLPLAALMVIISTWLHWMQYHMSDYANGWDAYYYIIQVKSLIENGHLHSPDASLIYPFFKMIYWVVEDYEAMYLLGIAFLAGLISGICLWFAGMDFGYSRTFTMRNLFTGVFAANLSMASPNMTYFCAQYPKNALGWVFFLLLCGAMFEKWSKPMYKWMAAGALLVLGFFGHRLTFMLGVLLVLGAAFFDLRANEREKFGPNLWWVIPLILVLPLGVMIPGVLDIYDFERIGSAFSASPRFAPYAFVQTMGLERLSKYWIPEIVLVVLAWAFVPISRRRIPTFYKSLWCLGLLLMWPFLKWTTDSMAFRFFFLFVLFLPMLAHLYLARVHNFLLALASIGLFVTSPWLSRGYLPHKHDPSYALYDRVTRNVMEYFRQTGLKPDLVIAHKSLAEYFTFVSGMEAMPWLPEYHVDSTRLWRIVHLPRKNDPDPHHSIQLGYQYFLIQEYQWRSYADTISAHWKNPDQIRPEYLLQKKRK